MSTITSLESRRASLISNEQIAIGLAVLDELKVELKAFTQRRYSRIPNNEAWDTIATWIDYELRGNLNSIRCVKRELRHWTKCRLYAVQRGFQVTHIAGNGTVRLADSGPASFGSATNLPKGTASDEVVSIALEVLGTLCIELKATTKRRLARIRNDGRRKERTARIESDLLNKCSSIYCLKTELRHWVKRRLKAAQRRNGI